MNNHKNFSTLPKIIAVDFDGVIVSDEFPEIGKPNFKFIRILRAMQHKGVKLILWTSRSNSCEMGTLLTDAVEACKRWKLEFDAINENIPEAKKLTGGDSRKVYADIYLDDRSVNPLADNLYWAYLVNLTVKDIIEAKEELKNEESEESLKCQENKPL